MKGKPRSCRRGGEDVWCVGMPRQNKSSGKRKSMSVSMTPYALKFKAWIESLELTLNLQLQTPSILNRGNQIVVSNRQSNKDQFNHKTRSIQKYNFASTTHKTKHLKNSWTFEEASLLTNTQPAECEVSYTNTRSMLHIIEWILSAPQFCGRAEIRLGVRLH